jgi:hypothetical protein
LDLRKRKYWEDEGYYITKLFSNLYSSSNIVRMITSGSMKWAELVACIGAVTNVHEILVWKPQ